MCKLKSLGPRTKPCGTPHNISSIFARCSSSEQTSFYKEDIYIITCWQVHVFHNDLTFLITNCGQLYQTLPFRSMNSPIITFLLSKDELISSINSIYAKEVEQFDLTPY